jgi:hypothetical protein
VTFRTVGFAFGVLALFSGCSKPKAGPAVVSWIPKHADWPDGETSYYDVLRNDTVTGKTVFRIFETQLAGKPVYEIAGVNTALAEGITVLHDSIGAILTRDSLRSLSAFQVRNRMSGQDTIISRYEPAVRAGKVILTSNGGRTQTLAAPDNTFDNSILMMAIRALDLKPGAHYLLTSVASFGPWTKPADVEVTGEETITVPAGEFACHKVTLQIAGYTLGLWYERREPHRYVRFENRGNNSVAVLTGYEIADKRR